jgi:hypothetical protein
MDNKPVFSISFGYGLLISVILVIFKLILYLIGIDDQSYWQLIYYILFALGLLFTMYQVRNNRLNGFITYGKAFAIGFYATLAVSIIMALYTYLFMTVINPEMISDTLAQAEEKLLETNPDMSDEEISQALETVKLFVKPGVMAVSSFVFSIFTGLLLTLVSAAFVKKNKVEVEI